MIKRGWTEQEVKTNNPSLETKWYIPKKVDIEKIIRKYQNSFAKRKCVTKILYLQLLSPSSLILLS